MFEDTKWVIRIRKSKKDRRQQSTKRTHKTKDRFNMNPMKNRPFPALLQM
jgi:hypothetical protein